MDNEATVMRQRMDETLAGLTGKLGDLEHHFSDTFKTVKDSVSSVRDTFDLKHQVRERPWTFFAGATGLGFVVGFRPSNRGPGHSMQSERSASTPLAHVAAVEHSFSKAGGGANGANGARIPAAAPSWLANLGNKFEPEIAELKGIVIGALLELVREIVTKQVYRPMERTAGDSNNGSQRQAGTSNGSGSPISNAVDV